MQQQGFFDSSIRLFETYREKMGRERPEGYNLDLANEVCRRLKQLSFLCERIDSYEKHFALVSIKDLQTYENVLFKLELYAECFYFVTWRICSILQHKTHNILAYLNTFEAKGVCDVRNQLIEHPEKESQIFMQSFMCGGDEGPVLKNARPVGDEFQIRDKGLWVNAGEFKDNLEKLLRAALEK